MKFNKIYYLFKIIYVIDKSNINFLRKLFFIYFSNQKYNISNK